MAQEKKRGCGYRKVGGMYLCGGFIPVSCDRLPYPLEVCPVCGAGIKVNKGFTKINPEQLLGWHENCTDQHHMCFMCRPTAEPAFIMLVGEKFYPEPADFMAEALEQGVSKRIPFVPKELEFGKTVVYLAHHKACWTPETDQGDSISAYNADSNPQWPLFAIYRNEGGHWGYKRLGTASAGKWFANFTETQPTATVWTLRAETGRAAIAVAKKLMAANYKLGIFTAFRPHKVEKLIWESEATPEGLEALAKRGITPVIIKDGDKDHAPGKAEQ